MKGWGLIDLGVLSVDAFLISNSALDGKADRQRNIFSSIRFFKLLRLIPIMNLIGAQVREHLDRTQGLAIEAAAIWATIYIFSNSRLERSF